MIPGTSLSPPTTTMVLNRTSSEGTVLRNSITGLWPLTMWVVTPCTTSVQATLTTLQEGIKGRRTRGRNLQWGVGLICPTKSFVSLYRSKLGFVRVNTVLSWTHFDWLKNWLWQTLTLTNTDFDKNWFWQELTLTRTDFDKNWLWQTLTLTNTDFDKNWFWQELTLTRTDFDKNWLWQTLTLTRTDFDKNWLWQTLTLTRTDFDKHWLWQELISTRTDFDKHWL